MSDFGVRFRLHRLIACRKGLKVCEGMITTAGVTELAESTGMAKLFDHFFSIMIARREWFLAVASLDDTFVAAGPTLREVVAHDVIGVLVDESNSLLC